MRRFLLSAVLLAAVLILQLTLINGLRLPGGGVPDLVLVVVAALGMANGPAVGAIWGFAAGFCLDVAPPASGIIGEYALVLCLVGWVCGRLSGTLTRSAWLPIIISAAAAAAGEILLAALGMALQPAQVSFASVRAVLPAAVIYDIALTPFVLYLVLLVTARLDEETAASAGAAQARLRRVRSQGGVLVGGQTAGRQGLAGTPGAASAASGAVLLGLGGWLARPAPVPAGPPGGGAAHPAARLGPRRGWLDRQQRLGPAARSSPDQSVGEFPHRARWCGPAALGRGRLGGRRPAPADPRPAGAPAAGRGQQARRPARRGQARGHRPGPEPDRGVRPGPTPLGPQRRLPSLGPAGRVGDRAGPPPPAGRHAGPDRLRQRAPRRVPPPGRRPGQRHPPGPPPTDVRRPAPRRRGRRRRADGGGPHRAPGRRPAVPDPPGGPRRAGPQHPGQHGDDERRTRLALDPGLPPGPPGPAADAQPPRRRDARRRPGLGPRPLRAAGHAAVPVPAAGQRPGDERQAPAVPAPPLGAAVPDHPQSHRGRHLWLVGRTGRRGGMGRMGGMGGMGGGPK